MNLDRGKSFYTLLFVASCHVTFVFVDTTGLESLAELIYLNLSYNQLTYVPITHEAAPLTRLMLAYNNIEQLLAVSELTGPEHLDFAGNCLTRTRMLPSPHSTRWRLTSPSPCPRWAAGRAAPCPASR